MKSEETIEGKYDLVLSTKILHERDSLSKDQQSDI